MKKLNTVLTMYGFMDKIFCDGRESARYLLVEDDTHEDDGDLEIIPVDRYVKVSNDLSINVLPLFNRTCFYEENPTYASVKVLTTETRDILLRYLDEEGIETGYKDALKNDWNMGTILIGEYMIPVFRVSKDTDLSRYRHYPKTVPSSSDDDQDLELRPREIIPVEPHPFDFLYEGMEVTLPGMRYLNPDLHDTHVILKIDRKNNVLTFVTCEPVYETYVNKEKFELANLDAATKDGIQSLIDRIRNDAVAGRVFAGFKPSTFYQAYTFRRFGVKDYRSLEEIVFNLEDDKFTLGRNLSFRLMDFLGDQVSDKGVLPRRIVWTCNADLYNFLKTDFNYDDLDEEVAGSDYGVKTNVPPVVINDETDEPEESDTDNCKQILDTIKEEFSKPAQDQEENPLRRKITKSSEEEYCPVFYRTNGLFRTILDMDCTDFVEIKYNCLNGKHTIISADCPVSEDYISTAMMLKDLGEGFEEFMDDFRAVRKNLKAGRTGAKMRLPKLAELLMLRDVWKKGDKFNLMVDAEDELCIPFKDDNNIIRLLKTSEDEMAIINFNEYDMETHILVFPVFKVDHDVLFQYVDSYYKRGKWISYSDVDEKKEVL